MCVCVGGGGGGGGWFASLIWSLYYCAVLSVLSSFAIIQLAQRERERERKRERKRERESWLLYSIYFLCIMCLFIFCVFS